MNNEIHDTRDKRLSDAYRKSRLNGFCCRAALARHPVYLYRGGEPATST